MPGYRKPGKMEAYESALGVVSNFSDGHLNDPAAVNGAASHVEFLHPALKGHDIRDVVAKAIRVERGRRIGETTMTKKSFDLNAIDCGMLAELRTELGHSTEVQTIREAIREMHAARFE